MNSSSSLLLSLILLHATVVFPSLGSADTLGELCAVVVCNRLPDFSQSRDSINQHVISWSKLYEVILYNDSALSAAELFTLPAAVKETIGVLRIRNQNELKQLRKADVQQYTNLQELEITSSSLEYIEPGTFEDGPKLQTLNLSSNCISTLSYRAFERSYIQRLDLSHNPLRCAAVEHQWLARYDDLLKSPSLRKWIPGPVASTPTSFSVQELFGLPASIIDHGSLTCLDERTRLQSLSAYSSSIAGRSTPRVRLSIGKKLYKEGETITLNCQVSGLTDSDFVANARDFVTNTSNFVAQVGGLQFRIRTASYESTRQRLEIIERSSNKANGSYQAVAKLTAVNTGDSGWYSCLQLSPGFVAADVQSIQVEGAPLVSRIVAVQTSLQSINKVVHAYVATGGAPVNVTVWQRSVELKNGSHELSLVRKQLPADQFYNRLYEIVIKEPPNLLDNLTLQVSNARGNDSQNFYVAFYDPETLDSEAPTYLKKINTSEAIVKDWHIILPLSLLGLVAVIAMVTSIAAYFICKSGKLTSLTDTILPLPDDIAGFRETHPLRCYNESMLYHDQDLLATVPIIPQYQLQLSRELGEGAFGKVYLAQWKISENKSITAAAKSIKNVTENQINCFGKEAQVLSRLDHANIVKFYGVSMTETATLLLLFEFMELGDLRSYLIKHGPNASLVGENCSDYLLNGVLLKMASDVARGLSFLHSHRFIHRDLAARNCLLNKEMTVKIADFGMSRDVYFNDYYKVNKANVLLPVRWLPPESLKLGKFTMDSDIWSFGVVLWELFTYGDQPWHQNSNSEVVRLVLDGEKLETPAAAPRQLAELMTACWRERAGDRPKIDEILVLLQTLRDPDLADITETQQIEEPQASDNYIII